MKERHHMPNAKNRRDGDGAQSMPKRFKVEVEFVLDHSGAEQVCVCGDFNGWQPDGLRLVGVSEGGLWERKLTLQPGRYEYKFLVDGEWVLDPNASENVPNDIGSLNSVVNVGSKSNS
jgi:1,4-alpha-glucan branching enzyme